MLRDRCPVCPVCLSVTLKYCGQTVGWIKMPLGTEVGPGDILLDGDLAAPRKGHSSPHFSAHVYCGQTIAHLSCCRAPVRTIVRQSDHWQVRDNLRRIVTCHAACLFSQVSTPFPPLHYDQTYWTTTIASALNPKFLHFSVSGSVEAVADRVSDELQKKKAPDTNVNCGSFARSQWFALFHLWTWRSVTVVA